MTLMATTSRTSIAWMVLRHRSVLPQVVVLLRVQGRRVNAAAAGAVAVVDAVVVRAARGRAIADPGKKGVLK